MYIYTIFTMIYYVLKTISLAILGTAATLWTIEETLIKLMMSTFLFALRIACHPLMVLPMLMVTYYMLRKLWLRRRQLVESNDVSGRRHLMRTPRMGSYRSMGSMSSRSNDICDLDVDETRRRS